MQTEVNNFQGANQLLAFTFYLNNLTLLKFAHQRLHKLFVKLSSRIPASDYIISYDATKRMRNHGHLAPIGLKVGISLGKHCVQAVHLIGQPTDDLEVKCDSSVVHFT